MLKKDVIFQIHEKVRKFSGTDSVVPDLIQDISWEEEQHLIIHHQRHHQGQRGELPFPIQIVTS